MYDAATASHRTINVSTLFMKVATVRSTVALAA